MFADDILDRRHLLLAANETRHLRGKIVPMHIWCSQRRKIRGETRSNHLKHVFRLDQIHGPSFAQVV
jgi:hypothetical protein